MKQLQNLEHWIDTNWLFIAAFIIAVVVLIGIAIYKRWL